MVRSLRNESKLSASSLTYLRVSGRKYSWIRALPTAHLMCDALRYDIAKRLEEQINTREGTQSASIAPARTALPTITALIEDGAAYSRNTAPGQL